MSWAGAVLRDAILRALLWAGSRLLPFFTAPLRLLMPQMLSSRFSDNALPVLKAVHAEFDGFSVVVCEPASQLRVYDMGCYGKGSLSRSRPAAVSVGQPQVQVGHRDSGALLSQFVGEATPPKKGTGIDPAELLHLLPEEAMFLSSRCRLPMEIRFEGTKVARTAAEFWRLFCPTATIEALCAEGVEILPRHCFAARAATYGWLRGQGYVVRPGLSFGVDYLLY
eukprot:RCo000550